MSEFPEQPRAVLFDWDNTLIDNWAAIHNALNAALSAMGHSTWSMDEALRRVRESMRDSFPRMFGDRWKEARDIFYETFEANHITTLKTRRGAPELIEGLAAAGIYLGVVSNKGGDLLRKEASHLGWDKHFDRLVGAGDAAADKPDVAPVEMALAGSGVARSRAVWFVGDAAIDMQCANAAGCVAILIGSALGDDAALDSLEIDHRFKNCSELATLVAGFKQPI